MVFIAVLVVNTDKSERSGRAGTRPSLTVNREGDPDVDFPSLQVVEDVLQRLPFEWDTVPSPRPESLDDAEIRVVFDTGDEPAVGMVDAVEQPEIVEAEMEQDECASYPLACG